MTFSIDNPGGLQPSLEITEAKEKSKFAPAGW